MNEIAEIINGTLHSGIPVEIMEYSIDSRSVVTPEHTLFFALTGNNHNGHDYIRTPVSYTHLLQLIDTPTDRFIIKATTQSKAEKLCFSLIRVLLF